MKLHVHGAGVIGPGLAGWAAACPTLAGLAPHAPGSTVVPAPERLHAAERRRAGTAVKLAIAVADDACAQAGADPATLATVFTSSNGDGANFHALCEMLAAPQRLVSPTRFTNSVHNAPAGFWHIAVAGRAASNSLCAHDGSFAAGLMEAAAQVQVHGQPVLLVASDAPYPEPLNAKRPMPDSFGAAFVLGLEPAGSLATLQLDLLAPDTQCADTACDTPSLDALRSHIPAARALPLLQALAARRSAPLQWTLPTGARLVAQVQAPSR